MRITRWLAGCLLMGMVGPVVAQTAAAGWVVKPEWVQAHEDFLASDVMDGRGSATRDEEIAATYVASEFKAYGLVMAPGMTSYLQSAGVEAYEGKNGRQRLRLTADGPGSAPAERKTFNAIGFLPGRDAGAGTILLTAHLDHLGVGKAVDGDAIYNGANDDASGTTAVLELAHALASGAAVAPECAVCVLWE